MTRLMERMQPRGCQKDLRSSQKKQKAETPKRLVDKERAQKNWDTILDRVCFFMVPMLEKMYLFRQVLSRNQEWFPKVIEDEEDNDRLKVKMMADFVKNRKTKRKAPTIPKKGYEGTRILGEFVFGERLCNYKGQVKPIRTFLECRHEDVDITMTGNNSQSKAFRCKACGGRWERRPWKEKEDLSYLQEEPQGTHILRYGEKHIGKTYYEVAQDKEYCAWTRRTFIFNQANEPLYNKKMFTHFHTWLIMHQTMKADYPSEESTPCPELTEEGWEIVGHNLALFKCDDLAVQGQKGEGKAQHFRLDTPMEVDKDNRGGATPSGSPEKRSPSKKKLRGGNTSPATGDTPASPDARTGKRTTLPEDSEDSVGKG